jgi:hypothetical protein
MSSKLAGLSIIMGPVDDSVTTNSKSQSHKVMPLTKSHASGRISVNLKSDGGGAAARSSLAFNTLVNNCIVHPTAGLMCPFIGSVELLVASSGFGDRQYKSPFDTCPYKFTNCNWGTKRTQLYSKYDL